MAKAIMVQGTMSSAGKSLLAAGLCRLFRQDGYSVAPFKSQNMALNSFVTREGLEMGRAQVMQAEAAGIEPSVLMNPILLKPVGDAESQVIVRGEVYGQMDAWDYYHVRCTLLPTIMEAYRALAENYDVMVLEGAGSPAEINLREGDIVNMGMAKAARSPVLLVGDIDRGGVFAQLYGTAALLPPEERSMVKGVIINKFRGDPEILAPGLRTLEERMGIPVVGVVPYLSLDLDDEDIVSDRLRSGKPGAIDLAAIAFPHLSNYTDLNVFGRFRDVSVRYVTAPEQLGSPDMMILPGSKTTMADLRWLRSQGLESAILRIAEAGKPVFGICGGYQMLGERLSDPHGTEGGGEMAGLGLLPVETIFTAEKTRRQVRGRFAPLEGFFRCLARRELEGYEIHMGQTVSPSPAAALTDGAGTVRPDGCVAGNVCGVYVHGVFDGGGIAHSLLSTLAASKGLPPPESEALSQAEHKERQYDLLAQALRRSLDMEAVYAVLQAGLAGQAL